jgi:hypothetical protein
MAADSAHAVDFERGVPTLDLKKSSGSGSQEYDEHSVDEATVPKDLPDEFAASLELHLDSKSTTKDRIVQRIAPPEPFLTDAAREELPAGDLVFGDPSTYGAAGGDAEATLPRVKDRALAIANWRGGLGTRPETSNSSDADNKVLDELLASESSTDDVKGSSSPAMQVPIDCFIKEDRVTMSREEPSFSEIDRITLSREDKTDTSDSALAKSPAGSRRVSSVVLRFWADTSQEEIDGAQAWMNCDPDTMPPASRPESPSLRKMFISNSHKPRVEDENLPSTSEWKRHSFSPSSHLARNDRDPFSLDTLAGLYEEPVKGVPPLRTDDSPVFDPFSDSGENAFDNKMVDFFNASIRLKEGPSSPAPTTFSAAPTTFSAPNFEPKTYEDPAFEDFDFDQPQNASRSSVSSRGGRRTSWGLSFKKNRRSNV